MSNNIIYEYEEIDKENKELIDHIKKTPKLHKYFKEDWGVLKAKQYCGILSHNKKDYYLLPKIANHDNDTNLNIFIYMLMYAYDIKLHNEDISSAKNLQTNNILEILVLYFAKNLLKEFTKGLHKTYTTKQENLTTLRGKYLINENLKYNFTKSKIYCEFDEFSEDNILNRFFLYTIKILLPYVKNKKLLKQCELALDGVEYQSFNIDTLDIHFERLNTRFKNSYNLAILILKKSIPMFAQDKKSFGFLFDMNDLFEDFIAKFYTSIDPTTKTQHQKNYGSLVLKPDIVTAHMIIDTKYKKVQSRKDLSVADKYQMFVYGTNFGIKNTMLLYPKHLYHIDENLELGKDDKMVKLKMKSINLDFDGEYDEFLDEIRQRIKTMNNIPLTKRGTC